MEVRIIPIHTDTANLYLLRSPEGSVLVNTGGPGREETLLRALQKSGTPAGDIGLVVLTHVHYDHVGGVHTLIKNANCPVAVHQTEADILKQGKVVFPAGTGVLGRSVSRVADTIFRPAVSFQAVTPDLIISRGFDLSGYGIDGRVIHTPGHTAGFLSVLLADGRAIVGDLVTNFPVLGRVFPPFADDIPALLSSWENLLQLGAK